MEVVSLRVTEVYGPGLVLPTELQAIAVAAVERHPLRLPYGADEWTLPIHVADAATAGVLALSAEQLTSWVYNISGGVHVTLAEIADRVRALVPGS
ncbi:hypothetical protein [Allokutzneria sp. NRRL B-24872]|uniref:hypothetical protein n=1 Tax=Allokutzneria sp. NRRL B-24872 TaxID=1137961 RepID=UPI001178491B|nr:hypothetical protein [Allokutzneria sp. NRRL B-24872]